VVSDNGYHWYNWLLACYKDGKFKEFKTNKEGFESAVKWADHGSLWAVEGSYCFGRPFVAHLIKNGCEVYEVNPLLTKTWRKMLSISNPKNDYGDAKVISINASKTRLQKISFEAIELKEKITARNHFVKDRTSPLPVAFYHRRITRLRFTPAQTDAHRLSCRANCQ
jgi:hypothetical protein